jgi:hypothetical protein
MIMFFGIQGKSVTAFLTGPITYKLEIYLTKSDKVLYEMRTMSGFYWYFFDDMY